MRKKRLSGLSTMMISIKYINREFLLTVVNTIS
jgi:hypothetical protein